MTTPKFTDSPDFSWEPQGKKADSPEEWLKVWNLTLPDILGRAVANNVEEELSPFMEDIYRTLARYRENPTHDLQRRISVNLHHAGTHANFRRREQAGRKSIEGGEKGAVIRYGRIDDHARVTHWRALRKTGLGKTACDLQTAKVFGVTDRAIRNTFTRLSEPHE